MNITKADMRLATTTEARQFDVKLARALTQFEIADMRLSRLMLAHDEEKLGGWPEGFEFPTEAAAAYSVLADTLEREAKQMLEWAANMRERAPHLWWVRGPAAEVDDA